MEIFSTAKLDTILGERTRQWERERVSLLEKTCQWLERNASTYGIDRAYLFGSTTRPHRFHPNSDIASKDSATFFATLTERLSSMNN